MGDRVKKLRTGGRRLPEFGHHVFYGRDFSGAVPV
jgi:hypothetical protein